MKSKFFKDTQGLEPTLEATSPNKISVCMRLDKCAYAYAAAQAQRLNISTGEYIERLLLSMSDCPPRMH